MYEATGAHIEREMGHTSVGICESQVVLILGVDVLVSEIPPCLIIFGERKDDPKGVSKPLRARGSTSRLVDMKFTFAVFHITGVLLYKSPNDEDIRATDMTNDVRRRNGERIFVPSCRCGLDRKAAFGARSLYVACTLHKSQNVETSEPQIGQKLPRFPICHVGRRKVRWMSLMPLPQLLISKSEEFVSV